MSNKWWEDAKLKMLRLVCAVRGHKWDHDRFAGPLHYNNFCWRCDQVKGERYGPE